jgi:hypothetical protein
MGLPQERALVTGPAQGGPGLVDRNGPEPSLQYCTNGVRVTVSADPGVDALHRWDLMVAATQGADVAQLSPWAAVRRHAGFQPIFVMAEDAAGLIGGALVLYRRLPAFGGVGYLPYGPVLPDGASQDAAGNAVCAALTGLTDRGLRALFVQPPHGGDLVGQRLERLGFHSSGAGIAPAATLELDLARPVEALHRALRSGTRGSIRQAARRGVEVRAGTERDLPTVAELMSATAAHHRFSSFPLPYLRALYRHLAPDGYVKIFIAEHAGVPVAAQVVTCCGGVAKLRLVGMRRSTPAASGAAALLQWETIQWAKRNGHRWFDFGGIAASAVDAIQAGPAGLADRVNGRDYFKASFGGRPVRYPQAVERFSGIFVRVGYDLAQRSDLGRRTIRRVRQFLRAGGATR